MRSAPRSERLRPDRHRLHPLFDGYAAAENRGTLALAFVNHSRKCSLLIESKVETGTLDIAQLRRHLTNAKRHYPGYRRVLLLVSPDPADTSAGRVNQLRHQPDVRVQSLPDRERVWVRASRWRLMNWTQGRQTGPTFHNIDLSIRAEDLLQRSNGKVLRDTLRSLACDASTKALAVAYRHYFLDAKLQKQLRSKEFGDRLLRSAKHLLDLYHWFGG